MSQDPEILALEACRSSAAPLALPAARVAIAIRPGVMDDLPFLDSLQKLHTKQVGWMPTKQLEGKIKAGHVLVAEEMQPRRHGGTEKILENVMLSQAKQLQNAGCSGVEILRCAQDDDPSVSPCLRGESVGYCIGHDQYFKRDDVGIIYQLNVVPTKRRSLVGATLVKAMFERAAWGCKLFCCWCAQDIEANHFWESIGFVPLAFRAGSRGKGRVHIFWQRRIREGDTTTPYWFPAQTTSGSIREDRLVFPIPPGVHWNDAMPRILPQEKPALEDRIPRQLRTLKPRLRARPMLGRLQFAPPKPAKENPSKAPRQKVKNDPKLIAAARELRDRWLERVNQLPLVSRGKYEVARLVDESAQVPRPASLLLPAA